MAFVRVPGIGSWTFAMFWWRVMKHQSDQEPGGNVNTDEVTSTNRGAGSSRRRFIKGGAAAAPVILTLTSRPVLGFDQACMAPSRMISGNHSGFTGLTTCGGNARAFWASQARLPSNQQPLWVNQFFTAVFGSTYPYKTRGTGNPKKLGPVLLDSIAGMDANTNSTSTFASYIIAAHLNALNNVGNVGTVLKPAQVKSMWYDVIRTGNYCPQESTTMCWSATGVIGYLNNSGIVPS